MKISAELLQKALELSTARGLATNDNALTVTLASNPIIDDHIHGCLQYAGNPLDLLSAFGTLFELGFTAGLAYRDLETTADAKPATKEATAVVAAAGADVDKDTLATDARNYR